MKRVTIPILLLLVVLCFPFHSPLAIQKKRSTRAGVGIALSNVRLDSRRLVEILNYGYVKELNEPPKPNQELRLRLYAVPEEGSCMPDTHVVCSHHYYLAVSTFEVGMGETVYDLGEAGEIRDIQWLTSNQPYTVRLKVRVVNYPEKYFEHNKSLVKRQQEYELRVSLERLSLRRL